MEKQSPILVKTYDFLKMIIPVLKKFPRDQKFLLGDRLQNLSSDILELFIEAYYAPRPEKKDKLIEANIKIEKMRFYFRLCYEMGFYHSNKYKQILNHLQEIGRMCGGWIKSL